MYNCSRKERAVETARKLIVNMYILTARTAASLCMSGPTVRDTRYKTHRTDKKLGFSTAERMAVSKMYRLPYAASSSWINPGLKIGPWGVASFVTFGKSRELSQNHVLTTGRSAVEPYPPEALKNTSERAMYS